MRALAFEMARSRASVVEGSSSDLRALASVRIDEPLLTDAISDLLDAARCDLTEIDLFATTGASLFLENLARAARRPLIQIEALKVLALEASGSHAVAGAILVPILESSGLFRSAAYDGSDVVMEPRDRSAGELRADLLRAKQKLAPKRVGHLLHSAPWYALGSGYLDIAHEISEIAAPLPPAETLRPLDPSPFILAWAAICAAEGQSHGDHDSPQHASRWRS